MTYTQDKLKNNGKSPRKLYDIYYDKGLSKADGIDLANELIDVCDDDFDLMTNWFNKNTPPTPITVQIGPSLLDGTTWKGCWQDSIVTINLPKGVSVVRLRYALIAEVTEMFMKSQGKGWYGNNNEGSAGEGLSHFLANQFLIKNGFPAVDSAAFPANYWMKSSSREDYVNNVDVNDNSNDEKTGCAILFIYYLNVQLGFSINSIIDAAAPTLAGVYKNLTKDSSNPFPFFKQLLDNAFPGTTQIPDTTDYSPFPLGNLTFVVDKSTFGPNEVKDHITPPNTGEFSDAFWLVLEGFNKQVLGSAIPVLSGAALGFSGISMSNPPIIQYERENDQLAPQRVRFAYDIGFSSASLAAFPKPGDPPQQKLLNASINILSTGFNASTGLEFVSGADPYFTNVNPIQNNISWLSQDLRVFTATPSLIKKPVNDSSDRGPVFENDNFPGAYVYIQKLINYLNTNFSDPSGIDPFNPTNNVIPDQASTYTGDSSVTPFTALPPTPITAFPTPYEPDNKFANYNFAIARVRLQGSSSDQARDVKVFFRMWCTQTVDTDYHDEAYPSQKDSNGLPIWPLAASDNHTIPFFATSNNPNFNDPNNPEYGTHGVNNQTIDIKSGDTQWTYFGCFLNVYDPSFLINGHSVLSLLTGTHHCLVAQIAYDNAPIINPAGISLSPNNCDKLAQRNLQVTLSDNPGGPATHSIPQTFDLRPSDPGVLGQGILQYPDELMIDWGNTPVGSIASIYWPQANASDVLQLASQLYGSQVLIASDANTIQCKVTEGVTYIPIPKGHGPNLAGLLTIDLPLTVVKGQEFNIIVRRITTRRPGPVLHIRTTPSPINQEDWRYVVGTFQVKIPVSTSDEILPAEENTIAIFKWRLQQMSPTNRWYPVLQRYISYLSGRVSGLGGNPDAIPASPNGVVTNDECQTIEYTGKVLEVIYDCFGDFEGFVLVQCCGSPRTFQSREHGIEEVVLRACKQRLPLSVYVEKRHQNQIYKLVIKTP